MNGLKKESYKPVIFFSILIIFLFLLLLVNPHTFHKTYFDEDFNELEIDEERLSSRQDITNFIERWIGYLPGEVIKLKKWGLISEEQSDEIIELSNEATHELKSYESTKSDSDLYRALFYTQKALSYKETYPFVNCGKEISKITKKYTSLFYYLNYKDLKRTLEIESTRKRLLNYLDYNTKHTEDKQEIIRRAKEAREVEDKFDLFKLRCDEFKKYLEKDYKKQRYWLLFKLVALIAILIIGFIFGKILTRRNIRRTKDFGERVTDLFKDMFSPNEIKTETINAILRTNSIIATLMIFMGIVISIKNFGLLIAFLIFLSILLLLSSIVAGIIALNNGSENAKRFCYVFFISGLIMFIGFFIYLIVAGSIITILKEAGEAVKLYLSNQTIS